ncbi:hypothetical protein HW532_20855 [Kaustia mangrovi]|uniref:Uncharacterized protein n=1 Tax=Kaustia mangrovi TaxID=2593653 RepID=A0A7S8C7N1_9HYPH|nr:hypothetical protein [Kaustia mangrovi]QPC44930.1 hypothetical protein HW532_20855 [Kaustia mangrovi]
MAENTVPGLVPVTAEQYAAEGDIRLDQEARDGGFFDSVERSFTSGGNYGYQIYKRLDREANAPTPVDGYDPQYDLDRHRDQIPGRYIKDFVYAQSPEEFQMIFADMQSEMHDQAVLARRGGVSTFVAEGLAGLVDLDTPIAFLSGGAAAAAKASRWTGRAARGALAGGASQTAMATVAHEAGTTGDWTEIPLAGLAGMGFGMVGGMMAKTKGGKLGDTPRRSVRTRLLTGLDKSSPRPWTRVCLSQTGISGRRASRMRTRTVAGSGNNKSRRLHRKGVSHRHSSRSRLYQTV